MRSISAFKGGCIDSDLLDDAQEALLQRCVQALRPSNNHLADDIEWLLNKGPWSSSEPSNELENILLRLRRGDHVRRRAYTDVQRGRIESRFYRRGRSQRTIWDVKKEIERARQKGAPKRRKSARSR